MRLATGKRGPPYGSAGESRKREAAGRSTGRLSKMGRLLSNGANRSAAASAAPTCRETDKPPAATQSETSRSAVAASAVQVDQDVAADDQIQMRERRIPDEIVVREQHDFAQLAAHPVTSGLALEEPPQARSARRRRRPRPCRSPSRAIAIAWASRSVANTCIAGASTIATRARPAAWPPNRLLRPSRIRPLHDPDLVGRPSALEQARDDTLLQDCRRPWASRKKLVTLISSSRRSSAASSGESRAVARTRGSSGRHAHAFGARSAQHGRPACSSRSRARSSRATASAGHGGFRPQPPAARRLGRQPLLERPGEIPKSASGMFSTGSA